MNTCAILPFYLSYCQLSWYICQNYAYFFEKTCNEASHYTIHYFVFTQAHAKMSIRLLNSVKTETPETVPKNCNFFMVKGF